MDTEPYPVVAGLFIRKAVTGNSVSRMRSHSEYVVATNHAESYRRIELYFDHNVEYTALLYIHY